MRKPRSKWSAGEYLRALTWLDRASRHVANQMRESMPSSELGAGLDAVYILTHHRNLLEQEAEAFVSNRVRKAA